VIKAVVTFGGSRIESAAIPFRRVPVFRDPGLRLRQKENTMARKITKKKKSGKSTTALASSLSWFVDRLNYTAILNAIEASEQDSEFKRPAGEIRYDTTETSQ
jgi:hypothetical protein